MLYEVITLRGLVGLDLGAALLEHRDGRGAVRIDEPAGQEEVTGVSGGDVLHVSEFAQVRDILVQDYLHGASPSVTA